MNRKQNNKGKKNPSKKQNGAIMRIERMEHPPQIQGYEIVHKKRMRFTVIAAAATTAISFQNLLDTIILATTNVLGYDVFDIVRIRSVEVWSQSAIGTPSTVTVSYSTATGDRSIHTDTSLGIKPAYIKAVPSAKSLASFWQVSAAGVAFTVTCPAGSVVDVSLSYKTSEIAPVAANAALVAANVGDIFYRGLDGLALAGTNFPPINGVNVV
jgi:hypothetical protein